MEITGEYGGKVLRAFTGARDYKFGEELTADELMSFHIRNRLGLINSGKLEVYTQSPKDNGKKLAELQREKAKLKKENAELKKRSGQSGSKGNN